jgi:hypothetical protein
MVLFMILWWWNSYWHDLCEMFAWFFGNMATNNLPPYISMKSWELHVYCLLKKPVYIFLPRQKKDVAETESV